MLCKSKILNILTLSIALFYTGPLFAAGGVVTSPNEVAPDRYVSYPGTEVLAKDEIRVIACGIGLFPVRAGQR